VVYDSCVKRPFASSSSQTSSDVDAWLRRHGPLGPDAPQPLVAARTAGVWVEDNAGHRYLDFSCGASAPLGYNHPDIIRAINEAGHAPPSESVEWPARVALMHKLAELVPGGTNRRVLLVDSGREALARAIQLAQVETGKRRVQYLSEVRDNSFQISPDTAALVVHPLDPRLKQARQVCTETRTLLVDDETGIGPGTTGRMFAIEWSEIRPDLYVLGRGWAAGLSFGACITGSSKLHWTSATPGGTAGCSAALELIRLLTEGLLAQSVKSADVLSARMAELGGPGFEATACGRGLVWTLVFPPGTIPADGFAARCSNAGLLLHRVAGCSVGVRPPLIVQEPDIDTAVGIMQQVLAEFRP